MSVEHPWMVGFFAAIWVVFPALATLVGHSPSDWNGRGRAYLAAWLLAAPLSLTMIALVSLLESIFVISPLGGLAMIANAFVSPQMRKLPFLSKHLPTYRPQSKFPYWKAV